MTINIFGHDFSFLADDRQWQKLYAILQTYFLKNTASKLAVMLIALTLLAVIVTIPIHNRSKKVINLSCLIGYSISLVLLFIVCRDPQPRGFRIFGLAWYVTDNGYHEANVLVTLLNLLLFIPFGFLLRKALGQGRKRRIFLITLSSALAVELLQLIFARGFFALQDILAYMIGGLIGWVLMLPFDREKHQKEREKEERTC